MAMIETILVVLSLSVALTGLIVFVLTFAAPKLLDGRFMRWLVTGPQIQPTPSNQRLMAVSAFLAGTLLVSNSLRLPFVALAVLVAFLPVTYMVVSRARRSGGPNNSLKRTDQSLRD